MPDDEDYKLFFDVLSRPETWTENDRKVMDFALRNQRDLLEGWHPKDLKRRASFATVIEQIEAAISRYDDLRSQLPLGSLRPN